MFALGLSELAVSKTELQARSARLFGSRPERSCRGRRPMAPLGPNRTKQAKGDTPELLPICARYVLGAREGLPEPSTF